MKNGRFLILCMLVMALMAGCGSVSMEDATIGGESGSSKEYRAKVGFVAVKLPTPDYMQERFDKVGVGTYYEYYLIEGDNTSYWHNIECMELPVELQDGEMAYVKADVFLYEGDIGYVSEFSFDEIKKCRKISLKEATYLIDIIDLCEYENKYPDEFEGLARYSKVNDCLIVGRLDKANGYLDENQENLLFYGSVSVYLDEEIIGHYNRLAFIGDYPVFFNQEDEEEVRLPEYITIDNIEELLATGRIYNDFMLVLYQREPVAGEE